MALNKVIMVGRLARDPEQREIKPGMIVCKMVLATNHTSKDSEGNPTKEVCFIEFSVWNKLAESCLRNLFKGSKVMVTGRLKMERWMDKGTNAERVKHVIVAEEIDFLETPEKAGAPVAPQAPAPVQQSLARQQPQRPVQQQASSDWDELPF